MNFTSKTVHLAIANLIFPSIALRQALIDLGFDDCYHMASVLNENPRDAEMWSAALEARFEGKGETFGRQEW